VNIIYSVQICINIGNIFSIFIAKYFLFLCTFRFINIIIQQVLPVMTSPDFSLNRLFSAIKTTKFTVTDRIPGINIMPFGDCLDGGPCISKRMLDDKWINSDG